MELKEQLLEIVRRSIREEGRLIEALGDAARMVAGQPEQWAPKDELAHIAYWKELRAQEIVSRRDLVPKAFEDIDHLNQDLFRRFQEASWEKVAAMLAKAGAEMLAAVEALEAPELGLPRVEGGRPLWRMIAGSAYLHPVLHLAQIYIRQGMPGEAARLQEETVRLLRPLSDEPEWQGTLLYNLACYHALDGELEQALTILTQALKLAPGLREWSKQDADLEALRRDPGYLAFFAD